MTGSCGHWSDGCFDDAELMGPFGGDSLSEITVGSLQDLGYVVDFDRADELLRSNLDASCRCAALTAEEQLARDEVVASSPATPDLSEDDSGRASAIRFGFQILEENEQAEAELQQLMTLEEQGLRDISTQVISVMYMDDNGVVRDEIVKKTSSR